MWVCVPYACKSPWRSQEGISSPEIEFQAVMSNLMWVLETKPVSSARTASTLSHRDVSSCDIAVLLLEIQTINSLKTCCHSLVLASDIHGSL